MAPWLGGAVREKCRHGKADQSPGLVHFARRIPAAHREQAVHIEPTEKAPPCLDRIKAVLGEREGAGTRRRPGIDQAHLDDIERAWCACKPAARLVDLELHPIQYRDRCIEPISKSFEEDDEASELHEAKEVLRIKLPADKDAALPLNPGEEPFDQPAPGISPKSASILRRVLAAIGAVRRDHLDAVFA